MKSSCSAIARATSVASLAVLSACSDIPSSAVAPSVDPAFDVSGATQVPGPDLLIQPRFEIDVAVGGSLKPGHPIHLTVSGQAFFSTRDGEVRLTLPEVAAAERSSWEVVELPTNEQLAAHFRMRKSFAAGEKYRERVTITIPEAGYYHVTATVIQHSDDWDTDGGRLVGSGAGRSLWLWVDERGGQVTESFDSSLFPNGTRAIPGPLGSARKRPRLHHPGTVITCTVLPGEDLVISSSPCPSTDSLVINPPSPPTTATATVSVTYKDHGAGGLVRPLVDAWVAWKVFDSVTGAQVASGGGYTNGSGMGPTIQCNGPTVARRLDLTVHTENRKAEVRNNINIKPNRTTVSGASVPCGGNIPIAVSSDEQAHVFSNVNKTWDGHRTRFGNDPPAVIRAGLYPVSSYGSHYDYNAGELHIEPGWDQVWREFGILVAAHEYGHLWHDRYLYQSPARNGLMRYYNQSCPTPAHPPGNRTNFGCAFGEAFADWYAVLVRESELPTWRRDLEENRYHLDARAACARMMVRSCRGRSTHSCGTSPIL